MILHESPHAKVEWLEKDAVILKRFNGFIKGEELRAAFNAGYECLKKHHGRKWLSDNRGLPVYKPEDVDWINNDWFPKTLSAGWRYWALVEPESAIGAMTMKKFQFYTDRGIILQTFESVEKALEWLASVD